MSYNAANKMRTFLVAIDGSRQSEKVLSTVVQLATEPDSRVIVLSVYRHYSNIDSALIPSTKNQKREQEPYDVTMRQLAHDTVRAAIDYLSLAGVKQVSGLVKRGGITRTIMATAKKNDVDAIVIGSRGMGEIEGLLLGSVSHKVNSLAKCTCITVR